MDTSSSSQRPSLVTTQLLPSYLTLSTSVYTNAEGQLTTSSTTLQLPLTYYGPSIPLGSDWTWGGLYSPTTTTTSVHTTATATSSGPVSASTSSISSRASSVTLSSVTLSTRSGYSSTSAVAPTATAQQSSHVVMGPWQISTTVLACLLFLFILASFVYCWIIWPNQKRAREARASKHWALVNPRPPAGNNTRFKGRGPRIPGDGSPRHSGEERDTLLRPHGRPGVSGKAAVIVPPRGREPKSVLREETNYMTHSSEDSSSDSGRAVDYGTHYRHVSEGDRLFAGGIFMPGARSIDSEETWSSEDEKMDIGDAAYDFDGEEDEEDSILDREMVEFQAQPVQRISSTLSPVDEVDEPASTMASPHSPPSHVASSQHSTGSLFAWRRSRNADDVEAHQSLLHDAGSDVERPRSSSNSRSPSRTPSFWRLHVSMGSLNIRLPWLTGSNRTSRDSSWVDVEAQGPFRDTSQAVLPRPTNRPVADDFDPRPVSGFSGNTSKSGKSEVTSSGSSAAYITARETDTDPLGSHYPALPSSVSPPPASVLASRDSASLPPLWTPPPLPPQQAVAPPVPLLTPLPPVVAHPRHQNLISPVHTPSPLRNSSPHPSALIRTPPSHPPPQGSLPFSDPDILDSPIPPPLATFSSSSLSSNDNLSDSSIIPVESPTAPPGLNVSLTDALEAAPPVAESSWQSVVGAPPRAITHSPVSFDAPSHSFFQGSVHDDYSEGSLLVILGSSQMSDSIDSSSLTSTSRHGPFPPALSTFNDQGGSPESPASSGSESMYTAASGSAQTGTEEEIPPVPPLPAGLVSSSAPPPSSARAPSPVLSNLRSLDVPWVDGLDPDWSPIS
ncbi:hypothetical protein FISHEDRAFT_72546 [Fistulina hepatica ATCC 64428]|nr:hypothetical protein FISHEDRAFT_72546 [Fistulina hepatica ATCC 64428]